MVNVIFTSFEVLSVPDTISRVVEGGMNMRKDGSILVMRPQISGEYGELSLGYALSI